MTMQQQLVSGRLVWAKVEQYPWWPGRIVKTIEQQNQTVFKIAFFADPTYSYLNQHQIRPFPEFIPPSNGQPQLSPALKRAVRMAQAFKSKVSRQTNQQKYSQVPSSQPLEVLPQKTEESPQQNLILPSYENLHLSPAEVNKSEQMIKETHQIEISIENVVSLLEKGDYRPKKQGYCYEQRKELIRYQDKLKDNLLKKYSLINFDMKPKKNSSSFSRKPLLEITVVNAEKKQKKITKSQFRKTIVHDQIENISKSCLRKINKVLKRYSSEEGEITRYHSMDIVRRMIVLSDNNHMKFKSLFVTLMKTMSSSRGMSCEERLYDFRHYLQRLEGEKGQDEEGSRITQIQSSIN